MNRVKWGKFNHILSHFKKLFQEFPGCAGKTYHSMLCLIKWYLMLTDQVIPNVNRYQSLTNILNFKNTNPLRFKICLYQYFLRGYNYAVTYAVLPKCWHLNKHELQEDACTYIIYISILEKIMKINLKTVLLTFATVSNN